jgi:hypothetical protein
LNFKKQKWRLIYRGSENGFASSDFHKHCDGFCNTLVLVRDENYYIFGGYSGAKWSSDAGFVTDPYAFVFSLSEKAFFVARCAEPERAIYCKATLGPAFGENDIKIANLSNENRSSCAVLNCYQTTDQEDEYSILAGRENFKTVEIEVYCKDYNELSKVKQNFFRILSFLLFRNHKIRIINISFFFISLK